MGRANSDIVGAAMPELGHAVPRLAGAWPNTIHRHKLARAVPGHALVGQAH